jgi:hypothetical protein
MLTKSLGDYAFNASLPCFIDSSLHCNNTIRVQTLLSSAPIWFQTYLVANLSDSERIWFQTYLHQTYLIPNLPDSKPIWFWTNLIPDQSGSEPTWLRTNIIVSQSVSEPIHFEQNSATKAIWNRIHLILNLSDIKYDACSEGRPLCLAPVPTSLQSWDDCEPFREDPTAKLDDHQTLFSKLCGEIEDWTGQPRPHSPPPSSWLPRPGASSF